MRKDTWLRRLQEQLPGWTVWRSSPGGWFAIPGPEGAPPPGVLNLPGTIQADTPAELRAACRERYGWYDYCETCVGVLARDCGHRQPEREKSFDCDQC